MLPPPERSPSRAGKGSECDRAPDGLGDEVEPDRIRFSSLLDHFFVAEVDESSGVDAVEDDEVLRADRVEVFGRGRLGVSGETGSDSVIGEGVGAVRGRLESSPSPVGGWRIDGETGADEAMLPRIGDTAAMKRK